MVRAPALQHRTIRYSKWIFHVAWRKVSKTGGNGGKKKRLKLGKPAVWGRNPNIHRRTRFESRPDPSRQALSLSVYISVTNWKIKALVGCKSFNNNKNIYIPGPELSHVRRLGRLWKVIYYKHVKWHEEDVFISFIYCKS